MGIEKIFSDLYMISYGPANSFLIVSDKDELILIDTGYSKYQNKIIKAINIIGKGIEQIKYIFLTHCHPDHAGNLARIKDISNASVYAHLAGVLNIREGKVMPDIVPYPGFMNGLLFKLFIGNKTGYYNPVEVDHEIKNGDILTFAEGIKVIHTPAHSTDHLIYFWPKHNGVLFLGDIASNMFGLDYMVGYNSPELAEKNLKDITKFNFDVACFGHGKTIKGNASDKFKQKWGII